jgi:hypothetical protein
MKSFVSRVVLISMFVCGSAMADTESVPVQLLADDMLTDGWSHLTRTDDMILVTMEVTGLVPGNAVTLWWVVLNADATAPTAIGNASGNVVKSDGTLEFGAVLREGENEPGHQIILNAGGDGAPMLTDADAPIFFVVQTHGQARGGKKLREQLSMFEANCTPSCADVQYAFHGSP